MTLLLGTVAVAALVSSGLLWQKLSAIQEQLARQSADSGTLAIEAHDTAVLDQKESDHMRALGNRTREVLAEIPAKAPSGIFFTDRAHRTGL